MIFFGKNSFVFAVFGSWVKGEDFKVTTELSEKVQYPHNQAIKNKLNETILIIGIKDALCSR